MGTMVHSFVDSPSLKVFMVLQLFAQTKTDNCSYMKNKNREVKILHPFFVCEVGVACRIVNVGKFENLSDTATPIPTFKHFVRSILTPIQ